MKAVSIYKKIIKTLRAIEVLQGQWLKLLESKPLYIEPIRPWKNGHICLHMSTSQINNSKIWRSFNQVFYNYATSFLPK